MTKCYLCGCYQDMSAREMVSEFHTAFGQPIRPCPTVDVPEVQLRIDLLQEELDELKAALATKDIVGTADALADLEYVLHGAALTFGIDLNGCVAEVHRSNMSKLVDGKPLLRADGKVLKGPDYSPPNLLPLL